ncbi:MAG: N-acetyltransferase [Clostridia bacterium]|nr:N-acetyltransferase [Clostridia bacterium]
MEIHLRLETPADYRRVEEVTREAFWGFSHRTCEEHYLIHTLRTSPFYVPQLDFVAEINGEIVGNIVYSKAVVLASDGTETEVLTFGPLSVLPAFQNKGVGSTLTRYSLLEAQKTNALGVLIYGHPEYYPRFGFQAGEVFGITSLGGKSFDALMALELYEGAFSSVKGKFRENSCFDIDMSAVAEFDKSFPYKEPKTMQPISILLDKLPKSASVAFEKRNIPNLAYLNRLSGREIYNWDGIDEDAMSIINRVLQENGFSKKLSPDCLILQNAKRGVRVLTEPTHSC